MTKQIEVTVTYQRCNASGEQCIIRHDVALDNSWGLSVYPEWVEAQLKQVSLHVEFLRSGWYQKQFEYNPN